MLDALITADNMYRLRPKTPGTPAQEIPSGVDATCHDGDITSQFGQRVRLILVLVIQNSMHPAP